MVINMPERHALRALAQACARANRAIGSGDEQAAEQARRQVVQAAAGVFDEFGLLALTEHAKKAAVEMFGSEPGEGA